MEAVGFVARISSLLELSEKVISHIKNTKNVNEGRRTLIKELAGTKTVLSELKIKANAEEWKATMEALMTENGPQDQFKSVLERLEKKLKPSGSKLARVVKSLTWHFDKKEINEILSQIERAKSLFVVALENKHMSSFCSLLIIEVYLRPSRAPIPYRTALLPPRATGRRRSVQFEFYVQSREKAMMSNV